MSRAALTIIGAVVLLQGCAGTPVTADKPADVTSNPSGAMVYADGVKLGETPLRHRLYDAFSASWKGMTYQAQGVLMVKLDGCEDYTLKVSDAILSQPIHAELECNGVIEPQKSTATVMPQSSTEKSTAVVMPQSKTEKRLGELEALYKKGIITSEEYKENRKRILSEL